MVTYFCYASRLLCVYIYIYIYISSECSAQGQVLHYKRKNLDAILPKTRSFTANSGTKVAALPGIE